MPTPRSLIPRRVITRRAWPFPLALALRWERLGVVAGATTPDGAATTTSPSTTTTTSSTTATVSMAATVRTVAIGVTAIGSITRSTAAGLLTATEARPTSSAVRPGATPWPIGRPTHGRTRPGSSPRAGWGIEARVRARVRGTRLTAELVPVQVLATWATAVGAQAIWAEAVAAATASVTSESRIVQARTTAARSEEHLPA